MDFGLVALAIGGIVLFIVMALAFVSGMESMTMRRRAWQLFNAGVIDGDELQRRLND